MQEAELRNGMMSINRMRMIIDTDPGIDDALAVLLAFGSESSFGFTVEAITSVFGNSSSVRNLTRNAKALAVMAGAASVPVFEGASGPINGRKADNFAAQVHGDNGFGNAPLPVDIEEWNPPAESAAAAIVRLAKKYPGEITLVTLGPLTNVALALGLCPDLPNYLHHVVVMGGGIDRHRGNKQPMAEANIYNDPDAASTVMNAGFRRLQLCTLDITHTTDFSEDMLHTMQSIGPVGRFIAASHKFYMERYKEFGYSFTPIHDSCAIFLAICPQHFRLRKACVDVERVGELTKGTVVVDSRHQWRKEDNCSVTTWIRAGALYESLYKAISALDGKKLDNYPLPSTVTEMSMPVVRVGVGVLLLNQIKEVLLLQRLGSHGAGSWSLPGGHLEVGESFQDCAVREVEEETGIKIAHNSCKVFHTTNDIMPYDGKHYVTIFIVVDQASQSETFGEASNLEPDKCSQLEWVPISELGSLSLFLPLANLQESGILKQLLD